MERALKKQEFLIRAYLELAESEHMDILTLCNGQKIFVGRMMNDKQVEIAQMVHACQQGVIAIRKQIPMVPVTHIVNHCPVCNEPDVRGAYCPNCGQKLKWGG